MVVSKIKEKVFNNPQDEAVKGRADIPDTLPVIPVKDTVLYPYTVIPLFVTEEKSIKAVEQAFGAQRIIGVVTIKSKGEGDVGPDELYSIGSAAVIHKMLRMPEKGMALIVQGLAKIAIKEFISEETFLKASVEIIIEEAEKNTRIEALMRTAIALTQKMISLAPYLTEEIQVTAINLDDPIKLAYLIATIVKMKLSERQELLELDSVEEKLNRIVTILSREVELLELGGKIQTQIG